MTRKGQNRKASPKVSNTPKKVRLNRFIANAGVCSRREADKLISEGRIKVNGKLVKELGVRVDQGDKILLDGKPIHGEKKVYILMNKPKDYITTLKDTHQRKIVTDLVRNQVKERVYPVGRLDRMTTGLLLLTNDGDLTKSLAHPSSRVAKIYAVLLDQPLTRDHEMQILNGTKLEDGDFKPDKLAQTGEDRNEWGIEIHSGKNRIIRRLFESYGYKVKKLDRVFFAGLTKKNLSRGQWRYLTEKEIIQLKYLKSH